MSFLDDAEAFMKQRQGATPETPEAFLMTENSREQFAKELRSLYENASWPEIYKAIDWVMNACEAPYDKKIVLQKIRTKLED